MQNLVLRAYLIYDMGVYIIFETSHTFSTCYQDMHVDSLSVSPGYSRPTLLLTRHSLFSSIGTGRPLTI